MFRVMFFHMIVASPFVATTIVSLPTGEFRLYSATSRFENIRTSQFFLDKTMFLKEFLLNPNQSDHVALIAPKRFGKSALLDTCRKFVERKVYHNGTVQDSSKLKELFKTTDIYRSDRLFFEKHFGQYPVIYFDFYDFKVLSFRAFATLFVDMVVGEFSRHSYMLPSLSPEDQQIYNNYWDSLLRAANTEIDPLRFTDAGSVLAKLLSHYAGKKVIVLIDEYDSLKEAIIGRWYVGNDRELKLIVDTVGYFVRGLVKESKEYVLRSIFIGITSIGGVLTQYADNLKVFSVFEDKRICPYFGITEKEVAYLAKLTGRSGELETIKRWYYGYYITGTTNRIYNMPSVMTYLEEGHPGPYWEGTPGLSDLKLLLAYNKFGKFIDDAVNNGTSVPFKSELTVEDLMEFRDVLWVNILDIPRVTPIFCQYLTENGYFTVKSMVKVAGGIKRCELEVPNYEIRRAFDEVLYQNSFFIDKYGISMGRIAEYVSAVVHLSGDESSMSKLLKSIESLIAKVKVSMEGNLHFLLFSTLFANEEQLRYIYSLKWEYLVDRKTNKTLLVVRDLRVRLENRHVLIIELKSEQHSSSMEGLKQVIKSSYHEMPDEAPPSAKILMGIYCSERKKCEISWLHNSIDIKEARSVPKNHRKT